jgi:hypothetical protein
VITRPSQAKVPAPASFTQALKVVNTSMAPIEIFRAAR